jgi:adenylylsulfate kinase
MYFETKRRSILKAASWRAWASITTAVLVFLFTGKFALAITVGCLEVFAKMGLFFIHERFWQRIRYGRRETPSFVLWFTGLPASGKKAVADRVHALLKTDGLRVERLDSQDVRPLFPETGFAPEEVGQHVKRSAHLCAMLEKNGIIVIASFVSPYRDSRQFARQVANNFIEVYMRSSVESCEKRDHKGHYAKARRGEYRNFPGIDVSYEVPEAADIVIDIDSANVEHAARQIVDYLKKNILFRVKPAPRLLSGVLAESASSTSGRLRQ